MVTGAFLNGLNNMVFFTPKKPVRVPKPARNEAWSEAPVINNKG
jgi:hypothetical protein